MKQNYNKIHIKKFSGPAISQLIKLLNSGHRSLFPLVSAWTVLHWTKQSTDKERALAGHASRDVVFNAHESKKNTDLFKYTDVLFIQPVVDKNIPALPAASTFRNIAFLGILVWHVIKCAKTFILIVMTFWTILEQAIRHQLRMLHLLPGIRSFQEYSLTPPSSPHRHEQNVQRKQKLTVLSSESPELTNVVPFKV